MALNLQISRNSTVSSVKVNGQTLASQNIQFHKEKKYFGFGRRKSEHKKLEEYIKTRDYGELSSFSGSVHAQHWTLTVGSNYRCENKMSKKNGKDKKSSNLVFHYFMYEL